MIVFCGKCFAAVQLGSVALHRKMLLQNFSLYRYGAGTERPSEVNLSVTFTIDLFAG